MHGHALDAGLAALGGRLDLLAFLALGLLGSAAHCVGMCAPFVMLVSRRYAAPTGRHAPIAAQLWYSGGRLVTYAALGAVAGALGGLVEVAGTLVGLNRAAAIVAGTVLVASALANLLPEAPALPGRSWFSRATALLYRRVPGHPLSLGIVLGLLPCGLLYSALVAAMTTGGALSGATAMAAFALGTIPALLGVSLAERLLLKGRGALNVAAQVFLLAMGAWYVWRGIGPMPMG